MGVEASAIKLFSCQDKKQLKKKKKKKKGCQPYSEGRIL